MSAQSLIQQFTELCSFHSISLTPEQLEAVTKKVERYQACCRCYNWNESLRELLLFYYQINEGIRRGVIDESPAVIHKKHPPAALEKLGRCLSSCGTKHRLDVLSIAHIT